MNQKERKERDKHTEAIEFAIWTLRDGLGEDCSFGVFLVIAGPKKNVKMSKKKKKIKK